MVRQGNGSVRTLPGLRDPIVRFDVGRQGLRDLHEGLVRLAQCLQAAGAQELFPSATPLRTIGAHDSPEEVARLLAPCALQLMTIHLMGSCPMAGDARRGVTDPYGAVWGQPRLWVNDASLLPQAPGVNPQGTVMAFARRNVLHYLEHDRA
jgi:choline dehydrogenase-like flavoprotein